MSGPIANLVTKLKAKHPSFGTDKDLNGEPKNEWLFALEKQGDKLPKEIVKGIAKMYDTGAVPNTIVLRMEHSDMTPQNFNFTRPEYVKGLWTQLSGKLSSTSKTCKFCSDDEHGQFVGCYRVKGKNNDCCGVCLYSGGAVKERCIGGFQAKVQEKKTKEEVKKGKKRKKRADSDDSDAEPEVTVKSISESIQAGLKAQKDYLTSAASHIQEQLRDLKRKLRDIQQHLETGVSIKEESSDED